MSDLISRDELLRYANDRISKIKEVRDSAKLNGEGDVFAHCNGEITEARRMKQYFNMFAPCVDAVPVVRCRECKKRQDPRECPMCFTEVEDIEGGRMYKFTDLTRPDGFCHMGAKADAEE